VGSNAGKWITKMRVARSNSEPGLAKRARRTYRDARQPRNNAERKRERVRGDGSV